MKNQGLSPSQVILRRRQFGPNLFPWEAPKTIPSLLLSCMSAPMNLLLVACSIIYLFLGNPSEGGLLLIGAVLTVGLDFYQTFKTEHALAALKSQTSPRALVIREGQPLRIPAQDLVPGDLILLSEGDRVPADAKLLSSVGLRIDESLLTGESFPVPKFISENSLTASIFAGTLVLSGTAEAEVTATGKHSQIGKMGHLLAQSTENKKSGPVYQSLNRIVRVIFGLSLIFVVLVVLLSAWYQGDWLNALLRGLSTSIAMIPEELPVVLTVFLAVGASKISKHKVLTRRLQSLETLGSVTTICVDKTGTLTENRMAIKQICADNQRLPLPSPTLPETFHLLIEYAVLSSRRDPFDPMEKAIHATLQTYLKDTEHSHVGWQLEREYPLTDPLKAMACVWQTQDKKLYTIAVKGAPEDVFDLCHFTPHQTESLMHQVHQLAQQGLRVLAVARSHFRRDQELPPKTHDFDFEYLGLLGFEDPLRESVPSSLQVCWEAGIKVIMLTGDLPETASKIASEAGFPKGTKTLLGKELAAMSSQELDTALASHLIGSRMSYENKLFLVQALQSRGEIVAMTGDGVNDAASLKQADIGIAMGKRGTDVAREAADIVLTEDDFSQIVTAIRMGRALFYQIRTAMIYILSLHLSIAALTIVPIFLKWPVILEPIHLVFLELIIDPSCTLALSWVQTQRNLMKEPPKRLKEAGFVKFLLLDPPTLKSIFFRGWVGVIVSLSLPFWLASKQIEPSIFRTSSFLVLLGTILGHLFGSLPIQLQSWKQNQAWLSVYLLALLLLFGVFYSSFLMSVFHFSSLSPKTIVLMLALGLFPTALMRYLFPTQ